MCHQICLLSFILLHVIFNADLGVRCTCRRARWRHISRDHPIGCRGELWMKVTRWHQNSEGGGVRNRGGHPSVQRGQQIALSCLPTRRQRLEADSDLGGTAEEHVRIYALPYLLQISQLWNSPLAPSPLPWLGSELHSKRRSEIASWHFLDFVLQLIKQALTTWEPRSWVPLSSWVTPWPSAATDGAPAEPLV